MRYQDIYYFKKLEQQQPQNNQQKLIMEFLKLKLENKPK